jgi:hypothetical protein
MPSQHAILPSPLTMKLATSLLAAVLPLLAYADVRMNLYHDQGCRDLYIANYVATVFDCKHPDQGYSSVIIWESDSDYQDGNLDLLTFYKHVVSCA